jgi:hypothetical protein
MLARLALNSWAEVILLPQSRSNWYYIEVDVTVPSSGSNLKLLILNWIKIIYT